MMNNKFSQNLKDLKCTRTFVRTIEKTIGMIGKSLDKLEKKRLRFVGKVGLQNVC